MDDKKLDNLLHEMKDDYEKLPEYTSTDNVMKSIVNQKRKISRGKIIPGLAIIAGLLLFMLISLPYVNDFDQADNDTNYLEMYYLKQKEEFREILGIESVDSFNVINQADVILEHYGSTTNPKEIEQAKADIDGLFTTPRQIMKEIVKENNPVKEETLEKLFINMRDLGYNLSDYWRNLLADYKITIDQQKLIIDTQDQPENYTGPEEIAEFLVMLKEQGFLVANSTDGRNDAMYLEMNYEWLVDNIENWNGHEGFRDYLGMLGNQVDSYIPGVGNRHGIPWTEFDEILLDLEKLLESYPKDREFLVHYTSIYSTMNKYLNDYLAGGVDTLSLAGEKHLDNAAQKELKRFVENHEESRFHAIVKDAVNKYENESDWVRERGIFHVDYGVLSILFDEHFREISFENIELVNRWPMSQFTFEQFHNYEAEKSQVFLEKLSAFEILSLYMYAHDNRDADLYSTLYSKESEWREEDKEKLMNVSEQEELEYYWREIINRSTHVIREVKDNENKVNYILLENPVSPVEVTASIQLVKEDGIWKVLDRTIE
ncbi:hypothetical protein CIL05_15885 [Virgibacillus profundi]|uniref:Uncharacterized protein n=1 Tax=Virgibacillus profundi TaxID=2024555 RepID=A0A2A2IBK0_9BACI|nr:hypothetical protein [Virgibacillus profundi]PAV28758.1 hypothetical protein CIL05_15885 [Virgibacillus profundi]PXY52926.1 hypothetical protein CIT14_16020 [Virgibacillus profundi]